MWVRRHGFTVFAIYRIILGHSCSFTWAVSRPVDQENGSGSFP